VTGYEPSAEQRAVVDATDPVLLVLGGAGTGKTTTAAHATVRHLRDAVRIAGPRDPEPRALFLSFSRASVAQVVERTAAVLGPLVARVEFQTFHGLAWQTVRQFGALDGHPDPVMVSEARSKIAEDVDGLRYSDLIPSALRLLALPAVGELLASRWGLVVCDEFQDTSQEQYELLLALRGGARLLLLGDPNQCIYSNLPGVTGVGPERLAAAMTLPGAREILLPEASYRDPSQVLPAAAAAIRRREHDHPAVRAALDCGRLQVRTGLDSASEAETVLETVAELLPGGTVGVISHHVDRTTDLSDALRERGVAHEVAGIPEVLATALDAQVGMVEYAAGNTDWGDVLLRLAVFVVGTTRGNRSLPLAHAVLGRSPASRALADRLAELRTHLDDADATTAGDLAANAHQEIGFERGHDAWSRATTILQPLLRTSLRGAKDDVAAARRLAHNARDEVASTLTHANQPTSRPVQLMGLYQSKGREADATVVVLRADDYFGGSTSAAMEVGLRLLYVVLTRARVRTLVLVFGDVTQPLVAPLAALRRG